MSGRNGAARLPRAILTVLLTMVSLSCSQQIDGEYPSCSPEESSCGSTHCSKVPLQESTITDNILCIDKDKSFPLRYNIQGCVEGRYTRQNTSGVCLSRDLGLFVTVTDLELGKEFFNCYQYSQFSSMAIIVFDRHNPYWDIIIEVNGSKRENASDLVEGDEVKIVAQAVGSVGNIVGSAICTNGTTQITCTSSFLCQNGSQSASRYFEYLFSPVTLAHDGIVVPFRTNDGITLGNVTLHVKGMLIPSATIVESPSSPVSLLPPESAIITPSVSSPPSSPTPSQSSRMSSTTTLPDATATASPAGDTFSDGYIILIVLVVVMPVILVIVLGIIFYFYHRRKHHNNCVRRKSEKNGSLSNKQHKSTIAATVPTKEQLSSETVHGLVTVMIRTCTTDSCPINSLKENLLRESIVTVENLPNNPSIRAIIEQLYNGAIWTTCGCEADILQNVLSRSSDKKWKNIIYLTNTRNNHDQTHEMVIRVLCDNLSDDDVLRTVREYLLDVQEELSRSSSVNSSKVNIHASCHQCYEQKIGIALEKMNAKIEESHTQVLESHTQILETQNNIEVKQIQILESQRRSEDNQTQALENQDILITQGHAKLKDLQCLESRMQDLRRQSHKSA